MALIYAAEYLCAYVFGLRQRDGFFRRRPLGGDGVFWYIRNEFFSIYRFHYRLCDDTQ